VVLYAELQYAKPFNITSVLFLCGIAMGLLTAVKMPEFVGYTVTLSCHISDVQLLPSALLHMSL